MKKLTVFLILSLSLICSSYTQGQTAQNTASRLSTYLPKSNFSLQGDLYYAKEADYAGQRFFSNNYFSTNIFNNFFDLGIRYEELSKAVPGFEEQRGRGLAHIYLKAKYKMAELSIGDFYEQFGTGLCLRSYEERSLGIDNSIRGAKLLLKADNKISFKLLAGQARNHFDRNSLFHPSRAYIYASDLEMNLNNLIRPLQNTELHISNGYSIVDKYEKEEVIIVEKEGQQYTRRLSPNVLALATRLRILYKDFDVYAEYAHKLSDPNISNNYSQSHGSVTMLTASYSIKGLSLTLAARESRNFAFHSSRSARANELLINHLQPFTQQHSYSLALLHPYATQAQGELALQAEVRYKFPKKSFLGGKYGSKVKLSVSDIHSPLASQEELYFRDINLEFGKKVSKAYNFSLSYIYQKYNQEVIEGHKEFEDKYIRSHIFVYDGKHRLSDNFSLRTEFQYLMSKDAEKDWLFVLAELSLFQHCVLTASQQRNISLSKENYYMYSIAGIFGAHNLQLSYGRTRAGINCSGGVCRYMPETKGVFLSYNLNF